MAGMKTRAASGGRAAPGKMRRVETILQIERPGDFAWYTVDGRGDVTGGPSNGARPTHLWFAAPDGSLRRRCIAPYCGKNGRTWQWDGSLDKPTLAPEIECRDDHLRRVWRGLIKEGMMVDE